MKSPSLDDMKLALAALKTADELTTAAFRAHVEAATKFDEAARAFEHAAELTKDTHVQDLIAPLACNARKIADVHKSTHAREALDAWMGTPETIDELARAVDAEGKPS